MFANTFCEENLSSDERHNCGWPCLRMFSGLAAKNFPQWKSNKKVTKCQRISGIRVASCGKSDFYFAGEEGFFIPWRSGEGIFRAVCTAPRLSPDPHWKNPVPCFLR